MKHVLFVLMLLPSLAFSQLEFNEKKEPEVIGEISYGSAFVMKLQHNPDLDYYLFMFRNLKFQSITDIQSFAVRGSDFESLYSTLNSTLANKEKKELEVVLDNGDELQLKFDGKRVTFLLWDGVSLSFSQAINLRQVDKLFGKGG